MSHRDALTAAAIVVVTIGCENLQDLGSHRSVAEAGLPLPGIDAGDVLPIEAGTGAKTFFVTDGLYTGDLGGLTGADARCTMEARAAGLGGIFKAWLSSSSENAKDRIAHVGPWTMVDGSVVFAADPVADRPQEFLRYSATRTDLLFDPNSGVWTGTNVNGVRAQADSTCEDWTSDLAKHRGTRGTLTAIQYWTDNLNLDQTSELLPCTGRLRLYCFEQ